MSTSPSREHHPSSMMTTLRERHGFIVSEFGQVENLRSEMHYVGTGRPCVHAVRVPMVFAVIRSVVDSLHWQPRLFDGDPKCPCIASIRDGVLTLAFDVLGPVPPNEGQRRHRKGECPVYRYHFELHPVKWWDEDEPLADVFLAVRKRLVVDAKRRKHSNEHR